jgi:hypothetical protein
MHRLCRVESLAHNPSFMHRKEDGPHLAQIVNGNSQIFQISILLISKSRLVGLFKLGFGGTVDYL